MVKPKYSPEFIAQAKLCAKGCRSYAGQKYFYAQPYLEDIESWCFLRYLEGRSLKTQFRNMVIDYFRKFLGDTRRKNQLYEVEKPDKNRTKAQFIEEVASKDPAPDEMMVLKQRDSKLFDSLIMHLTEREIFIMRCYYFQELRMHEIADLLGVTESRISQLHDVALQKLKNKFLNPKHSC